METKYPHEAAYDAFLCGSGEGRHPLPRWGTRGIFAIIPPSSLATPPAPIYFQVGGPLEIKPEFPYHSKVVGCALVSVSLLASSLPVLLKVAHLLLWKVHR